MIIAENLVCVIRLVTNDECPRVFEHTIKMIYSMKWMNQKIEKKKAKNATKQTCDEVHEIKSMKRVLALAPCYIEVCGRTLYEYYTFIVRSIVRSFFFFFYSSHAMGNGFFFVQPNADIEIFIVGQDQRLNEHDTWYHTHEAYTYTCVYTPYTYQLPSKCQAIARSRWRIYTKRNERKKQIKR